MTPPTVDNDARASALGPDEPAAWVARYRSVRALTEALAAPLSAEDQLVQSMPSCSPTKWHRAHTTWFFEEFVLRPRGHAAYAPAFRVLFNSYYEAVGPRHPRPQRGMLSRPSCDEVAAYRRAIDGAMEALLASLDAPSLAALAPLLALGLAHEQQHQELLLTDALHALWQNPLRPAYLPPPPVGTTEPRAAPAELAYVAQPGGLVTVGAAATEPFAFDNEGPRHRVFLEPYALASRLVTYGELRAFLEADGYRTPSLWLSEGLDWLRANELVAPLYVEHEPGSLRVFSHHGLREVADDEPLCFVSYYEADALARFLGARLPTEFEWEASALAAGGDAVTAGSFLDLAGLRAKTVVRNRSGGDEGFAPLFGDAWQWTSSSYAPYPGYAPASGAVGEYNGKFMVNQQVLRGGSMLTPPGHVRASYRNFWHPDTRFQASGVRLARSLGPRA